MVVVPSVTRDGPVVGRDGPRKRFIGGVPMKLATKTFERRVVELLRRSICCSTPMLMTATRSPIVIASIWSWVT